MNEVNKIIGDAMAKAMVEIWLEEGKNPVEEMKKVLE